MNSWEFLLWLSGLRTQLVSMRMWVRSLASFTGLRIRHCCKLRWGSKMPLRSSVAVAVASTLTAAPIQPLAWEPSYAVLKSKKINKIKRPCLQIQSHFEVEVLGGWVGLQYTNLGWGGHNSATTPPPKEAKGRSPVSRNRERGVEQVGKSRNESWTAPPATPMGPSIRGPGGGNPGSAPPPARASRGG